ncbi:hypothetical protein J6590_008124 [Homalodisca vitripennis]|nr:hypothetical protein J6590_008124 [Homalodisca vitripennis]
MKLLLKNGARLLECHQVSDPLLVNVWARLFPKTGASGQKPGQRGLDLFSVRAGVVFGAISEDGLDKERGTRTTWHPHAHTLAAASLVYPDQ